MSAALAVFADQGYEAASVRDITGRAKVNQGAITYHFGGKEGLYREVLRTVRDTLGVQPLLSLATLDSHAPAAALRLFIRQTLSPLADTARFRRSLRIFAWEQLKPTRIRQRLSVEEPFPTVALGHAVMRRLLPHADERFVAIATAWLLGQTFTFIRDGEWLVQPPFNLTFDRAGIAAVADSLADLSLKGLENLSSS